MSQASTEDVPLWPDDATTHSTQERTEEEQDMGVLKVGALIRPPSLPGKWSVWSQSNESPGAYFVVPVDDEAHAMGVKCAVVRARLPKAASEAVLTTLRTDPHRDLT